MMVMDTIKRWMSLIFRKKRYGMLKLLHVRMFCYCTIVLVTGCASIQFQRDLDKYKKYQDHVWDKTQPEFSLILDYLAEHHDMARSILSSKKPEVLAVCSSYYYYYSPYSRGDFAIILFEEEIGKGYVLYANGSGDKVDSLGGNALWQKNHDIESEGIKRQRVFNDQRRAKALKKKYMEEENAIRNPRKINLEELIGINYDVKIDDKMQDAGIWPDLDHSVRKTYKFFFPRRYREGTIPGLKPITESFHICSVGCDNNGCFTDVFMMTRVKAVDADSFITSLLHTVQAKLHTNKAPYHSSGDKDYRWVDFELANGRRISIWISIEFDQPVSTPSFPYYSIYFSIHDVTESYKIRQEKKHTNFWGEDMPEESQKADSRKLDVTLEGPMYDLFNKIKGCLAVIKTGKGTGSGFIAQDGACAYLYTNEHVIRGGSKPIVSDLEGNDIKLGDFELAKGLDLARFKINDGRNGLQLLHDGVQINTDITVFGNSDGVGVITALNGKVIGIGPSLLEVSAEFVQGNSGSPVLTIDGQVVGIATFAVDATEKENWVKKDTRFNGVRRFALRIDNANWKKMDWELYSTIINR